MLLSYLGALKSWIYYFILYRIRPSYLTIRLPVLADGHSDDMAVHLVSGKSARPESGVGGRPVAGHRHCVSFDNLL